MALGVNALLPGVRASGCEVVIADAIHQLPAVPDLTAGWTNAGRRTGARQRQPGGSLAVARQPRHVVTLTDGDDVHEATIVFGNGEPGGLLILGRDGDDVIVGFANSDHLEGERGNDTLFGRGGDDLLHGRTGDDRLFGEAGDDELQGGRGRDALDGGPGDDRLTGGYSADRLRGGAGRDRIVALDGTRDIVDCGPGRDTAIVDRRDRVSKNCERVLRGSQP